MTERFCISCEVLKGKLKEAEMAGKRDQSKMSLSEFKKTGMVGQLSGVYYGLENLAILTLEKMWSKQAANRLRKSAKEYGITPLELLGRFIRKA